MNSQRPSRAALAFFLPYLTSAAHAWPSPRAAVEHFLQFELDGGRLAAWPFEKYLAVPKDYEEPGWDEFHVVQSWKIDSPQCSDHRCNVRVTFAYVPTAKLAGAQAVPHLDGGKETVNFVATQVTGSWLLESSMAAPRISLATFKREHLGQP